MIVTDRGQGLNNALKDASDIVDATKAAVEGKSSLANGISEYENEMRVRGAKEVAISHEQARQSSLEAILASRMFKIGLSRDDGETPNGVAQT